MTGRPPELGTMEPPTRASGSHELRSTASRRGVRGRGACYPRFVARPSPRPASAPVALVTGAAVRVGRAMATRLVDDGYRVWIHYRSSEGPADELARALGPGALGPVRADLADPAARGDLARRVLDPAGPADGRLDLLVNSAASFERGALLERTDEDLRRVLETNLVAPVSLTRALAPALAAAPTRPETGAAGCAINIVDLSAFEAWPGYLDHGVSKAGLASATRGLAVELAPVRVNAVAPGTVDWPPGPDYAPGAPARERILSRIPLGRVGTPEDVARAVLDLAHAPYVTGHILVVDGGRRALGGGRAEGGPQA